MPCNSRQEFRRAVIPAGDKWLTASPTYGAALLRLMPACRARGRGRPAIAWMNHGFRKP